MSIISVQNFSKKYFIKHEKAGYITLRDRLAHPILNLGRIMTNKPEEFWALKDVSFNLEEGEVLGIVGANGSGKSTLLKLLSRITPPTSGRAVLKGRVSSLLEVGTGFHSELSGRENIFLSGVILGMTKKEISQRFDEIVSFAGVEKFLDTPVKYYSSGMGVRLGFAVAAHLSAEILIIDEVLAVGDADFQKKCLAKMNEVVKNQGRTILFVSHNIASVKLLCTKALLLKNGSALSFGLTDEVIGRYYQSFSSDQNKYNQGIYLRSYKAGNLIDRVELRNSQNELTNNFNFGDFLNLKVYLSTQVNKYIDSYLVWSLYDEQGLCLASGDTKNSGFSLNTAIKEISVQIGPLPLSVQRYFLELGFGSGGSRLDTWKDEITFDILNSDPLSRGLIYHKGHGSFFIPSKFSTDYVISRI